MLKDMVTEIQKLGIKVHHIPGGYTSCCQLVEVRFNNPFKSCIKCKWHEWIFAEAEKNNEIKAPSCNIIAKWIVAAYESISDKIICNS